MKTLWLKYNAGMILIVIDKHETITRIPPPFEAYKGQPLQALRKAVKFRITKEVGFDWFNPPKFTKAKPGDKRRKTRSTPQKKR